MVTQEREDVLLEAAVGTAPVPDGFERIRPMDDDEAWPVVEIFGPTIQGEGALAGAPTHFVRFGGCDYRCSWCDSMYAVDPGQWSKTARRMTAKEIADELDASRNPPDSRFRQTWVTLSGGNPAIYKLGPLIDELQVRDYRVAVETQGSRWRDWLANVDMLTVSPKPPSSAMTTIGHAQMTERFMRSAASVEWDRRSLKIVVFDDADYEWAKTFIAEYPLWDAYLSVGTDQPPAELAHLSSTKAASILKICDRYRWLCEKVAHDVAMNDVRVIPQLHVFAWGHAKGV